MPSPLVIPGVQVRTEFEPAPVLPGATGILGVVGVTDRGPLLPTAVGNFGEFIATFGPASRFTLPEVRTAFANGVAEVVVARTDPGSLQRATATLLDDDGEQVAVLEARAEGTWAHGLAVRVSQVRGPGGGVKYVNLEVSLDGRTIEQFNNLVMDETSSDYFFDRINQGSSVLVAYDPLFAKQLPAAQAAAPLVQADARAATATLRAGATDVVRVTAKRAGGAGNQIAVKVDEGTAGLTLNGPGNVPSLAIRARQAGSAGTGIRIAINAAGPGAANLVVTPAAGAPRTVGPFSTVDEAVAALRSDPDVVATKLADALPAVIGATSLGRRVNVTVFAEGRDPAVHADLADQAAIAATSDPLVTFETLGGATQLPDAGAGVPLTGGRGKAPALQLTGDTGDLPLLELVLAPGVSLLPAVAITRTNSSADPRVAVANLTISVDDQVVESYSDLTMDPDDPGYLPAVLQNSALLRGYDLFVRSRTTSFPRLLTRPLALTNAGAVPADTYLGALERLEAAEEVDLVIASVNNQLANADIRLVHQAVAAHCTKMADVARNRIGLGSIGADDRTLENIADHANDVRSDYFILVAPAQGEAAVAGLLGRQDYFQSPTFKTIPLLGAPPGRYSDAELTRLITENVLVVNERRRLGIIVMKGLLTSGRQVNVQRTVNKAVRDVKAIADQYVGLLNNEGTRNALRQQVFALLLQMERDGALVPSTDGADPAFKVDVYSTQADFANGIVRVDIAVRPVRAIDYIYATILVKN